MGPQQGEDQERKLSELGSSLHARGVVLEVQYSATLHDRQVMFDSGWVVKIGRGLDIYKPPEGKIVLGAFDLGLRKCLETTVDSSYKDRELTLAQDLVQTGFSYKISGLIKLDAVISPD